MRNFARSGGPNELLSEVIEPGLCSGCGMCLALCPNIVSVRERLAVIRDCGLREGLCYAVCPKTATDLPGLGERIFGGRTGDPILGHSMRVAMSRAADAAVRKAGQYGGTVTALAALAVQEDLVDAVLLTRRREGEQYAATGFLARTAEEVLAGAGSKYTTCPSLEQLGAAERAGIRRLGIVGRPCQVTAIRKLQFTELEPGIAGRLRSSIKLVIGLFCVWGLEYRSFIRYLRRTIGKPVFDSIDIPKDAAVIARDGKRIPVPYDDLKACRLPACDACGDMTAELADLAVGSTEWKQDWNTLIVRSPAGRALIDMALSRGVIEIQGLPDERFEILRRAVAGKKERAREQAAGQQSQLRAGRLGDEDSGERAGRTPADVRERSDRPGSD